MARAAARMCCRCLSMSARRWPAICNADRLGLNGCRTLFLTAIAPVGPMSRYAVSAVVREACWRVGVPRVGAHRLRHTLASEMLAAGASLEEIGQVLRHRERATTAIYARVDRAALRAIALPWPEVIA